MSQIDVYTRSFGRPDGLEPEPHLAADQKIYGGIALIGSVSETDLTEVRLRLDEVFEEIRSDETHESGNCVAYGYSLRQSDEEIVDVMLLEGAMEQNHGMLTQHTLGESHFIWEGRDKNGQFILSKKIGPIILKDGISMPHGPVYSLLGKKSLS